jgi:hypothetical protein
MITSGLSAVAVFVAEAAIIKRRGIRAAMRS